jgi:acyl carrier protein phosphodiesterase
LLAHLKLPFQCENSVQTVVARLVRGRIKGARRTGLGQPVIVLMVVEEGEMRAQTITPARAAGAWFSKEVKRLAHIRVAILAKSARWVLAGMSNVIVKTAKTRFKF